MPLLIWTSCKSTPTVTPAIPPVSSPEEAEFITEFVRDLNFTHMAFNCHVFNIHGKKIATFNGGNCWFESTGHVAVGSSGIIYKMNEKTDILWKIKPLYPHHTFSKSVFADNYLTLNSEYLMSPEYGQVRYDELLVLNDEGKIIKNFKFSEYDKKHPLPRPPTDNKWTIDKVGPSKEFSHGNSFKEISEIKNGKPVLGGYVYSSVLERKIYFLDRHLKKIIGIIDASELRLHDIQQYSQNKLIAYGNSYDGDPFGAIYLIEIKKKSFETLYKFTDKRQASPACSSVQFLPGGKLFIVHSKCKEEKGEGFNDSYAEFVNLKTGKNAFLRLDHSYPPQSGYLTNLTSFLSKSYWQ